MDETAIADKRDNAPTEIDYFRFGEILAQFSKQRLRGLAVIAGQHVGIMNRRLLARRQLGACLVMSDFRNQFFSQTLLPCQGKSGVQSEITLILLRHLHPR